MQEAERILLEDAPITPLCFMTQKYLKAPELKGLISNPISYLRWQDFFLDPAS